MRSQTEQTKPSPADLLNDAHRITVSVSDAARILGIAKSTAHNAYRATGLLMDGVPVLRVGRRYVVSTAHLRAALGHPDPSLV